MVDLDTEKDVVIYGKHSISILEKLRINGIDLYLFTNNQ